ncbi:hypothetical protein JCM4814A_71210 [Streptomyces phaeofaciens JCM 4814]|uniref:DUF7847 domain-containing protein n=1 Tax=Streptomyces phaeofaciens TaxID=68254 RepID=A0A918H985_9ACTN|nr:glycerophosphoryl diester phosphodiesterase membrane domain-containing protein [Streptomyces phaeofaciens]GGT43129.1 hypothetical protein GCM10010226_19850 [Streptomyces phaeofaciens]
MNDTPGWASPGSAPSDGRDPGASDPADRPTGPQPADQPDPNPQSPGTKWSNEQPPPAPWSAPAGPQNPAQPPPPPPPGPGWGGRPPAGPGGYGGRPPGPGGYGNHGGYGTPGWGSGWGGPPPAVKPGVIPLRPLGVGEMLDGAVSTMRTYWRTALGISLTVSIVFEIAAVLLQGLVLDDALDTSALGDTSSSLEEQTRAMGDVMRSSGLLLLISMLAVLTATALLAPVVSRAVLGKPVTLKEAWRDARPQIPRMLGLTLVLLLITAGVAAVCVLPGILVAASGSADGGAALISLGVFGATGLVLWLVVRYSLAAPALMLEKQGIRKSLSRSAKLVRGSWWRMFGIQLLAVIIANIISVIVVVPFALLGAALSDAGIGGLVDAGSDYGWTYLIVGGIGSVIGSMITLPIAAGVTVLLYIDQRIRREALDLDLARAAGVQGYGSPGTTSGG